MNRVAVITFVMAVGVGIGVGCAKSDNDDLLTGVLGNEPADGGKGDAKSIKIPAKGDDDDDDTTSSSSSSSSSSSGESSSSSSSSTGGTPPPPPPPPPNPCGTNVCTGGTNAGSVSGDTGADVKNESGAASKWFTIDVTENDKSLFTGHDLYLRTTLTSPPGKNFDLFVYLPTGGGIKECHAGVKSSVNLTGDDKVEISWGEGTSPNGVKDDRTVTIEVREIIDMSSDAAAPAACDPTALWTLKIEGDK